MAIIPAEVADGPPNHPNAKWMAVIAGLSHNMIIGTIFGSFSVMLAAVETRMDVTPEQSALGIPLVIVGSSLVASVVGVLAAKFSLRLLMSLGAALAAAAYVILAMTTSYTLYLVCFGLFFGPAMALSGSIGPATLVTRWFTRHRGLALGLVHLSIVVAILPVLCNWVLENYGAAATYWMLAGMVGIGLLPFTLLIRDFPPGVAVQDATHAPHHELQAGSLSVGQLLRMGQFWGLALPAVATMTGAMMLGVIMIPMTTSWHIDRAHGAALASIMSFAGMAGSVLFGWVADKLGGARGLALLAFDCALLWGVLLLRPDYPVLVVVVALLGLHGAGIIPNISRALADSFGLASFSRAFGLVTTVTLPFAVVAVVGSAAIFTRTGSYAPAIVAMGALLAVAVPLALLAGRGGAGRRVATAG